MRPLSVLAERLAQAAEARRIRAEERDLLSQLRMAGEEAVSFAKLNVPVQTGALRDSIGYRIVDDAIVLEATVPYAPYVEFGTATRGETPTGPYVITPKRANALRFTVGGQVVYAKRVVHPGVRPRPFLRPALRHAAGILSGRGRPSVRRRGVVL